jgi:hypothetical protein
MTCIEIFTRESPFPTMKPTDIAPRVALGTLRPEIPKQCPSSFVQILSRCVAFNASERPLRDEILSI